MKKLLWWLVSLCVVVALIVAHFIYFSITDSAYEKWLRSTISSSVRALTTLDSNDFEFPVSENQTFLIQDELVVMTGKLIYLEGEPVDLYSLSESAGNVDVYQVTETDRTLVSSASISPNKDNHWTTVNSETGFDLSSFAKTSFDFAPELNGWLDIEVTAGKQHRHIPVFIQQSELTSNALFIESTNTLKAYNSANNLRNNYSNPYSLSGQFSRSDAYPMNYEIISPSASTKDLAENKYDTSKLSCSDHLVSSDLALKSMLRGQGQNFDTATDQYLTDNEVPNNVELLIFGSHDEYWTSGMFEHVQHFVERGGSVLFLGGNTAWRFVEETNKGFEIFWGNGAQTEQQNQFVDEILGTYWDMRGYNTYAPMKLEQGSEDLSKTLKTGTQFGSDILVPGCKEKISGISGSETDKIRPGSSPDFEVIARGENPWNGGADVVFRKTKQGGYILNFSSIGTWQGASDPIVNEIVSSYLAKIHNK